MKTSLPTSWSGGRNEIFYPKTNNFAISATRYCGDGDVANYSLSHPEVDFVPNHQATIPVTLGIWVTDENDKLSIPTANNYFTIAHQDVLIDGPVSVTMKQTGTLLEGNPMTLLKNNLKTFFETSSSKYNPDGTEKQYKLYASVMACNQFIDSTATEITESYPTSFYLGKYFANTAAAQFASQYEDIVDLIKEEIKEEQHDTTSGDTTQPPSSDTTTQDPTSSTDGSSTTGGTSTQTDTTTTETNSDTGTSTGTDSGSITDSTTATPESGADSTSTSETADTTDPEPEDTFQNQTVYEKFVTKFLNKTRNVTFERDKKTGELSFSYSETSGEAIPDFFLATVKSILSLEYPEKGSEALDDIIKFRDYLTEQETKHSLSTFAFRDCALFQRPNTEKGFWWESFPLYTDCKMAHEALTFYKKIFSPTKIYKKKKFRKWRWEFATRIATSGAMLAAQKMIHTDTTLKKGRNIVKCFEPDRAYLNRVVASIPLHFSIEKGYIHVTSMGEMRHPEPLFALVDYKDYQGLKGRFKVIFGMMAKPLNWVDEGNIHFTPGQTLMEDFLMATDGILAKIRIRSIGCSKNHYCQK